MFTVIRDEQVRYLALDTLSRIAMVPGGAAQLRRHQEARLAPLFSALCNQGICMPPCLVLSLIKVYAPCLVLSLIKVYALFSALSLINVYMPLFSAP